MQALEKLADELLEVGRPVSDNTTSSTETSYNECIGTEDNLKNDLKDLDSICETIKNQNTIPETHTSTGEMSIVESKVILCSNEKSLNHSKESTVKFSSNENICSREDLNQYQSPMTNLKNLLERKNENLSSTQATEIAKKLYCLEGQDKRGIIRHLLQKDEFSALVAEKYMRLFDFANITIDNGLRLLLRRLALLGETQEREKVLLHFTWRYKECNPRFLDGNLDAIHVLVCAITLLNTDLHGVRTDGWRRMTSKQFINNLSGVSKEGHRMPHNMLKEIYRSIKKKPLPWCDSSSSSKSSIAKSLSVHKSSQSPRSSFSRSQSMKRFSSRPPPICDEIKKVISARSSKTKTIPRKQGVLYRKAIFESDGNKTVRRKRKWKLFMVSLQGIQLHLAKKDTSDVSRVSLHHCLAEMETISDSTKRQNVFRLTLANRSIALYQASDKEETEIWVNAINRNAAILSAAPLSAGIGSELKFRRPLMPTASSTLPLSRQLSDQNNRLDKLRLEILNLEEQPLVGAPMVTKDYHREKSEFLRCEIHKYEVYTQCLSELVSLQMPSSMEDGGRSVERYERKTMVDTESLNSVCPSEPGIHNKASSLYQSSEDGGSYEDLIDADRTRTLKRPRASGGLASNLVPTSSLPNLHPDEDDEFHVNHSATYHLSYMTKPSPSPTIEYLSHSSYIATFKEVNSNNSNNSKIKFTFSQHPILPCIISNSVPIYNEDVTFPHLSCHILC